MVPENRRLVGCKWVFRLKKDGTYSARLVALGYSQVPGVDFTDNFAPVVNDVTLRLLIVLMLVRHWVAETIDVETAFLFGDIDTEIYMKLPEGLQLVDKEASDDDCCRLLKPIYGLVQSARQWWEKFVDTLAELCFHKARIDPCLLFREDSFGVVYICIYVDDAVLVGNQEAVNKAKEDIRLKFTIKEMGPLKEYIGVSANFGNAHNLHISQPDVIARIEKYFGDDAKELKRTYDTPLAPGTTIIRPEWETDRLNGELQSKFRSGVGSLLYLVKHSRPDLANTVRELSKVMDGATMAHLKELYRVVRYVLDSRDLELNSQPDLTWIDERGRWKLLCYSDSDHAGDRESRKSVGGHVLYVLGVPIEFNVCFLLERYRSRKLAYISQVVIGCQSSIHNHLTIF